MRRTLKIASLALALGGLTGCDAIGDFLTGPGVSENPNFPLEATAEQLLLGVQGRMFVQQEGQLARTAAIWTQQIGGINNQQRDYGAWYRFTELDLNTFFNGVYTQGGLVDTRLIRAMAREAGDTRLEAIAMVWEALNMGTATSVWGDIPYREAVSGNPAPRLDPQEQIYADVQQLLSDAIALLQNAPTTQFGPDVVYNGDTARWIAAANTLKARYYLHTAPRHGQAAYQNALNHANLGINEAPTDLQQAIHGQAPGDFRAWHGSTQDDANIWAQFLEARQDIVAHQTLIDTLRVRNDPRLEAYHSTVFHQGAQQILGANQWASGAGPYSRFSATRSARNFRQPIITWAENQLIKAEANLMLGNEPAARANVNDVRARVGMPALPAPMTLRQIMTEKWIAQFQNIDAYSDWRRTCFPRLVPGGPTANVPAARIPGRFVYGQTERQQNPHFQDLPPARQPADVWAFAVARPGSAGQVVCPRTGDDL